MRAPSSRPPARSRPWGRLVAAGAVALGAAALVAGAVEIAAGRIEDAHPPLGRFVEVAHEGARGRLHLFDTGAPPTEAVSGAPAPVIVLLHGASGNLEDARLALADALKGEARVLAFDRPGHGWSDRTLGRRAAEPEVQAALIASALRALRVERAVIVGHSLGGAIATSLALDHPDLVSGLVLLSAVTHPWPGTVDWWNAPLASEAFGGLLARLVALPAGHLVLGSAIRAVFSPNAPPENYGERAAIPLILRKGPMQANAQDLVALRPYTERRAGTYGRIRVPTAVLGGDRDRVVWTDLHARSAAAEIPGARLVVLPGIGHMPHHAATAAVVEAIRDVARRAETALDGRGAALERSPAVR